MAITSPLAYWCAVAQALPPIAARVPLPLRAAYAEPGSLPRMFQHLIACHENLVRLGCPSGEDGLIPQHPEDFCHWYAEGSEPRLQQAICASVEDLSHTAMLQHVDTSLTSRQRMASCSAANAGAWLLALPSSRQLSLSDDDFRIASRIRLGLPPLPSLPVRCSCGAAVAGVDDAHFLPCRQLCPTALTHRHDSVVRLLADLFRKAGAAVH